MVGAVLGCPHACQGANHHRHRVVGYPVRPCGFPSCANSGGVTCIFRADFYHPMDCKSPGQGPCPQCACSGPAKAGISPAAESVQNSKYIPSPQVPLASCDYAWACDCWPLAFSNFGYRGSLTVVSHFFPKTNQILHNLEVAHYLKESCSPLVLKNKE